MLRKFILTATLALTTLGAMAAPNYRQYSDAQLQQEFTKLEQANTATLAYLKEEINNFATDFGEREFSVDRFLSLATGYILADLNQNFTITPTTYRQDPRITNLVNLADVCYHLSIRNNYESPNQTCSTVFPIYLLAYFDRDLLQSLIIVGTSFNAYVQEHNNIPLQANQQALLKTVENLDNMDLGFQAKIPDEQVYLKDNMKKSIYATYKVHLLPNSAE